MQEEVAQENRQKIEAEKQTVYEAKTELDKHRETAEEAESKYASVRELIDQLDQDMEPLKVQYSFVSVALLQAHCSLDVSSVISFPMFEVVIIIIC